MPLPDDLLCRGLGGSSPTLFARMFECLFARLLVVPASWGCGGGVSVVAWDAESATVLWVVGVESEGDECASVLRVVVCDCGYRCSAADAYWVAA